ncbi:hypothetical protein [Streptomyces sp. NPDC001948]
MMTAQQAARTRAKITDGLTRTERALLTRPDPKARVERYRSGAILKPQKRLQAALVKETESE